MSIKVGSITVPQLADPANIPADMATMAADINTVIAAATTAAAAATTTVNAVKTVMDQKVNTVIRSGSTVIKTNNSAGSIATGLSTVGVFVANDGDDNAAGSTSFHIGKGSVVGGTVNIAVRRLDTGAGVGTGVNVRVDWIATGTI